MTEETTFGMSSEEFKENIITAAIMSIVSFGIVFIGMAVKHYVKEKIE